MQTPKVIGIIAKHGENLEYVAPGSRKNAESRSWAVVFIGGRKKMVSNSVESQDGCPTWNCEVTIDLVSASDPVVMLVVDAKRRHVGQVIVPLAQVPQTGPPNFDMSRLQCSELEPTKKNSTPRGRLYYWIWAIDYWPPGTKIKPHKSIRGSLSTLGRGFGSRSSKAGSMVSGAYSESNLSGGSGLMPGAGTGPWKPSIGPVTSYNPFDDEDGRSGLSQVRNSSESDTTRLSGRPPIYLSVAQVNNKDDDADSVGSISTRKSSGLRGLKKRMSKSIQNLHKAAAKKAGGDKLYGDGKNSMISVMSARDSISPASRMAEGSMISLSRESYQVDGAPRQQSGEEMRSAASISTINQPSLLPHRSVDSQSEHKMSVVSGIWGLHPEERARKPIEDMSRREAVDYAIQMERSLREARSELTSVRNNCHALSQKVESYESDLNAVRSELANLRNRLLQDDLTQYLEVPSAPQKPLLSFSDEFTSRGSVLGRSASVEHSTGMMNGPTSWW